jgi:hypothetical protein
MLWISAFFLNFNTSTVEGHICILSLGSTLRSFSGRKEWLAGQEAAPHVLEGGLVYLEKAQGSHGRNTGSLNEPNRETYQQAWRAGEQSAYRPMTGLFSSAQTDRINTTRAYKESVEIVASCLQVPTPPPRCRCKIKALPCQ